MNVKLLPLLGLVISFSSYVDAEVQSPIYTEVKENRVLVDLEGANYYGYPEFDWQVND